MLLGGKPDTDAITNIIDLPGLLAHVHGAAAVVGLSVIAVLLIWPRLPRPLPLVPAPLVAVVGVTALPRAFSPWWVWQAQQEDHGHGALQPLLTGVREYHRRSAPELLTHRSPRPWSTR